MDFPVKVISQLRPLLVGFRKSAGLTQAELAERLGVTQQTYAQLEARPEAVSTARLFRVLRLLNVDLTLSAPYTGATASGTEPATNKTGTSTSPGPSEQW